MKVRLLPVADQEILDAAQWYEHQGRGLGGEFLTAVNDGLSEIEQHPQHFGRPPHFRSARDIRRLLLPRFPYAIIFEIRPRDVRVVAVAHVRRRPNYWRTRLG